MKVIRSLYVPLMISLALMLSACAVFGPSGDQEWQQLMTRNTQLRTVSTQAASEGKLSKADFSTVVKRNGEIRKLLDDSQTMGSLQRSMQFSKARSAIGELETFLKSKGVTVQPAPAPAPVQSKKSSSKPPKKEK